MSISILDDDGQPLTAEPSEQPVLQIIFPYGMDVNGEYYVLLFSLCVESSADCLFWTGSKWSLDVCTVVDRSEDQTTCSCSALIGQFAVSVVALPPITLPSGPTETPGEIPLLESEDEPFVGAHLAMLIILVVFIVVVLLLILFLWRQRSNKQKKIVITEDGALLDDESDLSDYVKEEERVTYSLGEPSDFSELSEEELRRADFSLGLEESASDREDEEQTVSRNGVGTRLARLGSASVAKEYGSTKTHRDSFQTEYDLDSTRNQSTKPQTARLAREREDPAAQARLSSPRYTSGRIPSSGNMSARRSIPES